MPFRAPSSLETDGEGQSNGWSGWEHIQGPCIKTIEGRKGNIWGVGYR